MDSTFASALNIQCENFEDDYMLVGEDIGENDVFYTEKEMKSVKVIPDETFYDTSDEVTQEPTAPPISNTRYGLLAFYLMDKIIPDDELTRTLIFQMEDMWFKITGHPFAMYHAESDLLTIITNLQYREHQVQRLYNVGIPLSRAKMMELHARFYEDFGCRISDFYTNESFKRMIDSVIAESFV